MAKKTDVPVFYFQKDMREVRFRTLSLPTKIYTYFPDRERMSALAQMMSSVSHSDKRKPIYTQEEERKEGYRSVPRAAVYIFDEADQKIKIYPMPITVSQSIAEIIVDECSDVDDTRKIMFVVERSGTGLQTRYNVRFEIIAAELPYEVERNMEQILCETSIVDILNGDARLQLEKIEEELIDRFDILDFE